MARPEGGKQKASPPETGTGFADGEGEGEGDGQVERNAYVFSLDSANPANNDRIARAYADEARLHQDLRSAGLL